MARRTEARGKSTTRKQLAEVLGVGPRTVDAFRAQGMPCQKPGDDDAPEPATPQGFFRVTRKELAEIWDVHQDTITKWLPDGLAAAVIERRPRGDVIFDLRVATRWKQARDGQLNVIVLQDFQHCAKLGIFALHVLPMTTLIGPEPEERSDGPQ